MFTRRRVLVGGAAFGAGALLTGTGAVRSVAAPLSDEEFFGIPDGAGGWSKAGQFDYSHADLAAVKKAAESSDYSAASKELLLAFRTRTPQAVPEYLYGGVEVPGLTAALSKDYFRTLGQGDWPLGEVNIAVSASRIEFDLTAEFQKASGGTPLVIFLAARIKGTATALIRRAGVRLSLRTESESKHVSPRVATYLSYGSGADVRNDAAAELRVHDEGTGPYSEGTARTYLVFDIPHTDTRIVEATLRFEASADQEMRLVVFRSVQVIDETVTWNSVVPKTVLWGGGFGWRDTQVTKDPEYHWQLNRQYELGPLAKHYSETVDNGRPGESFAQAVIDQWLDFLDAWGPEAPTRPRSLDASIRLVNWIYALDRIRNSPRLKAPVLVRFLKAIWQSSEYLSATTASTPNWNTSHMSGLFWSGIYLTEFRSSKNWLSNAKEFFETQLDSATRRDGGYVEATDGYAWIVARSHQQVAQAAAAAGIVVDNRAKLRKLVWFLADQVSPAGISPGYGDSGKRNVRSDLAKMADWFDDDELRHVADLGQLGSAPAYRSKVYPDTGVAIQRSGWTSNDWYARLAADAGQHSHPDDCEILMWAGGRFLLPSSGFFTYEKSPISEWLRRDTSSKNTVKVDGRSQSVSLRDNTGGGVSELFDAGWAQVHEAWTRRSSRVVHRRRAVMIDGPTAPGGFWLVADDLRPSDARAHSYEQNWHLLPDARVTLGPDGTAETNFNSGTQLTIVPDPEIAARSRLVDGYHSRVGYEVTAAKYVEYQHKSAGDQILATILAPQLPGQRVEIQAARPVAQRGNVWSYQTTGAATRTVVMTRALKDGSASADAGIDTDAAFTYSEEGTRWIAESMRWLTTSSESFKTSAAVNVVMRRRDDVLEINTGKLDGSSSDANLTLTVTAEWVRSIKSVEVYGLVRKVDRSNRRESDTTLTVALP